MCECSPGYTDPALFERMEVPPYDDQDNEGDKCREALNGEKEGAWSELHEKLAQCESDPDCPQCVKSACATISYLEYQIRMLRAIAAFWKCRYLLPM